eukprot:TRINITY_DN1130_c0_g2_i2.p1 TRINITY_DN1130_c0_g2~~TRINITY_DN1130_c0_g2_i2.p1  ORF type:complete len:530 (-),score=81.87 TRINITY_DN1130_c0_g2_i2:104-1693(-)
MLTSRANNDSPALSGHAPITARDKFSTKYTELNDTAFRVRPVAPKINLTQRNAGALKDLFQNFEGFIRGMIERDEDVASEEELYLRYLSEYLGKDEEEIRHFKRIEIIADTTNLSLQTLGETLKELQELKLNGSVIRSIRDLGTSYKALRVLWISRVGLKDLNGLLPLQSLEELYASYNYVSDISDIEYIGKLHTLDLEANSIEELRQLTYISSNLKSITLTDNKVTEHPDYLKTLLKYGTGLESIDDVDVSSIIGSAVTDINSQINVSKADDGKLMEELKKYGVAEDIVRESISLADSLLKAEPSQQEILRQSIKIANTKSGLKDSIADSKASIASGTRIMTASVTGRHTVKPIHKLLDSRILEDKNQVEMYSELVSNTDTVFAGNPLKAAKQKRLHANDKLKIMNIYELMEQFKGEVKTNSDHLNEKTQDEIEAEKPAERAIATIRLRRSSMEGLKKPETQAELRAIRMQRINGVESTIMRGSKMQLGELKAIKVKGKVVAGDSGVPKRKEVIIKRIKRIKKPCSNP